MHFFNFNKRQFYSPSPQKSISTNTLNESLNIANDNNKEWKERSNVSQTLFIHQLDWVIVVVFTISLALCMVCACVCMYLYVCVCVCWNPDLGPAAGLCMSMCYSDFHHCSRSASASPLNACTHHSQNAAERWRVSSASTPDITQRQRRRNSTPVGTHEHCAYTFTS